MRYGVMRAYTFSSRPSPAQGSRTSGSERLLSGGNTPLRRQSTAADEGAAREDEEVE